MPLNHGPVQLSPVLPTMTGCSWYPVWSKVNNIYFCANIYDNWLGYIDISEWVPDF